ncbi:hypothetical protein SDC9_154521 [bioreactor metagenome]|uniref:ABC transporter domain-containing protein n=1 Tax=bioreactor metagenome TaxID=1076179 RepID=A0A645EYX5_9ZZZZ
MAEMAKGVKDMMEIEDLKVSYGKSKVINGVSLKICQGDKIVIMGRNGVGKPP